MLGNLAKNLDAGLRPRASDFYDAGSFLTVHLFIITLKSFFFFRVKLLCFLSLYHVTLNYMPLKM